MLLAIPGVTIYVSVAMIYRRTRILERTQTDVELCSAMITCRISDREAPSSNPATSLL